MSKQLPYGMPAELTDGAVPIRPKGAAAGEASLKRTIRTYIQARDGDILLRWLYGKELLKARDAGNKITPKERQEILWRCHLIESARQRAFGSNKRTRAVGHVYVLEFASGSVKVGKTGDPSKRLGTHAKVAAAHGDEIVRRWVSPGFGDFHAAETTLIRFCSERGESAGRAEFFRGVAWSEVVEYAETITQATS